MSVRWAHADGTVWPVDCADDDSDSTQWTLRYGEPTREAVLSAASILSAYATLVDPRITMDEAIESLRRARTAAAKIL